MAAGDLPIVARRRVRLAVRRARDAKGWTQSQVADEMEWSLSKVMRIEKGDVSLSVSDLRALLDLLEVTDPTEIKTLLDDTRSARSERRTGNAAYREHLTAGTQQLLQFEAEAIAIRYYSPVLIPGPLQTEEYARAVFRDAHAELPPDTVNTRVEARLRRRDQIVDRDEPAKVFILLDEPVLHRAVGGNRVMGEQLRALLKVVRESEILVRIVPLTAAAPIAILGQFMILDLSGDDSGVLYKEYSSTDELVHAQATVQRHRHVFEELWGKALNDAESAALIGQKATEMLGASTKSAS